MIGTKKIFLTITIISMLIFPVIAQDDDYYYPDPTREFSDQIKAGMEFQWVLSKFTYEEPSSALGLNQESKVTTVPPETTTYYTTTATTSAFSDEYTETVYVTEETINEPDFSTIKPGLKIKVKILKDLADLGIDEYYEYFYEPSSESEAYMEMSFSQGETEEMQWFIPIFILITPNTVVFENGTRMSSYQYDHDQYLKFREEYSDFDDDYPETTEFSIEDGVAIRKTSYTDSEDGETSYIEFRYDIATGILVYVNVTETGAGQEDIELEIKLEQSTGIDIKVANDDPTLSVPISAIFVYTLILIPIVVNRRRKH